MLVWRSNPRSVRSIQNNEGKDARASARVKTRFHRFLRPNTNGSDDIRRSQQQYITQAVTFPFFEKHVENTRSKKKKGEVGEKTRKDIYEHT